VSKSIIDLNDLCKNYDEQIAVNHLTLSIKEGEIFGLLGPNGAGKSTTILMILGLVEPTSGTIQVCGNDATRQPLLVKKRVGYLPDDLGFYNDMTGLENLMYTAALNNIPKDTGEKKALSLLDRVGLAQAANKNVGKYSRGMRQRLGLADVLIKDPEIIILDEPTLGIDPEGVKELLELIKKLNRDEKITVLLSSHHLHQVQQICDRIGLFVNGQLLAVGEISTLAAELFNQDSIIVDVKADDISEKLIQKILELPDISKLNQENDKLEIYCKSDVTPTIARILIQNGALLNHISKRNYGLEEIYHKYFEGNELYEGA
jgi:ABC-2 type transport system ATP-binding protein